MRPATAQGLLPRQFGGGLCLANEPRAAPPPVGRSAPYVSRETILMAPSEGSPLSPSGTTRLYGIMGYPIAHSLSPLMQTFAFHHHHLVCAYLPFPVAPER